MNDQQNGRVTLCRYDYLTTRGIMAHKSSLLRWEKAGRFPQRVRPGGANTVAWIKAEIDDYLASLADQREVA